MGIVYGNLEQHKYEAEASRRQTHYSNNTYTPARNACLISPVKYQANCVAEAANEARKNERDEQDLVAQRVTALWTYIMGTAAVVGMVLSAVGVFLVWTTFRATREANEITRGIGQAQVRAYISETGIRFEYFQDPDYPEFPHGYKFRHDWENTGNSPAFACDLDSHFFVVGVGDKAPVAEILALPALALGAAVVATRGKMWTEYKTITGQTVRDWLDDKVGLVLYCRASYRDVFDTVRFTEAASYLVKNRTAPEKIRVEFSTYPHHNTAT